MSGRPAPAKWVLTTLGQACNLNGGGIQTGPFGTQLHAHDYVANGVPCVMPENIGDNRVVEEGISRVSKSDANRLSRYALRADDIVCSRRGDVTRRALIRDRENGWLCGTGCLRVRPGDSGTDARYLSYYLAAPPTREWITRHAHGATMPNLNTAILSALPITLPPHEEQRAIAAILGALDDKIDLNRRMSKTLEAIARALFKSWFVDFDPVRAKAEGRAPGLPKEIADLFPADFEESDQGEIPAGWRESPFAETVEITGGGTPKTSTPEYWGGDVPWFSVADAADERTPWCIYTTRRITKLGVTESAAVVVPERTTIISARGTVGRIVLTGVPMAFNQSCYALRRPHEAGYLLYFSTKHLADELKRHAHGSVFDTITRDTLSTVSVPVAPAPVVRAFESIVEAPMERIRVALRDSDTLAQLRDALLPKLISGEIRVPQAKRFIAAAASGTQGGPAPIK